MDVLFTSEKLQRQLSSTKAVRRAWGAEACKKVPLRLQQLQAAPTLDHMRTLPGRCHELAGARDGSLAVDVHRGHRLVFHPTARPAPAKTDGGLDWTAVESVTVTEVVDYH